MKIQIIKVGRIAYPEIKSLAQMYQKRLRPFGTFESVELKDLTALGRHLKSPAPEHPLLVLDEGGKQWTSRQFSQQLNRWAENPAVKSLRFLIGGPLGLPDEVIAGAESVISLSQATLTSDLAWLVLWEQIYRGFQILKGTGYHHED